MATASTAEEDWELVADEFTPAFGEDRRTAGPAFCGMRVIIGCCWPKGISPGGVLAACFEGSRRCRSRTGTEPGETANRALRSDPVGAGASGQAGWR